MIQSSSRRTFLNRLAAMAVAGIWLQPGFANGAVKQGGRRIVCVGGGITEIVYVLGAEQALVGVDTTSLYPQAATTLPSVGYARALSSEGILALRPTHLLATEDAGPPSVLRQVSDAGVPVTILAANDTFEGVIERIQRVGALTDRNVQASHLEKQLRRDWQRARAPILARKTAVAPRVLFVLSHSPGQVMVGGKGCSADAIIAYVGARNAVDGFDGFKPLTPEAVIAAQPDIVLMTTQGMQVIGGIDGVLKLPGMAQTSAGQKRRVVALEAMFMLGFGPRLPQALTTLDQLLINAMQVSP